MKSEGVLSCKVSKQPFIYTRLKTKSETGGNTGGSGENVVLISGSNSDGKVVVHLDIKGPSVVTSEFYNTGFMDAFIGYNHLSGSASKSRDKIDFTANCQIIIKIIWQGIELKKLPIASKGYFNTRTGHGEITNI